jgi:hypothetical protein
MNIPVSGIILIPCTLAIFIFASSRLSEWGVFFTIFQAAAIANIGGGFSFSLTPYFFVAMLVATRVIPQWWNGRIRFAINEPLVSHLQVMVLFVCWTVFSAFVLPQLFAGTPVDNPRKGVDVGYFAQMPLRWSFSNAGQAAYMVLNLIMLLEMLRMSENPGYHERLQRTFSWSGACVVAVGAYQVLCSHLNLQFPAWLFNSNTEWGQAYNQFFNGISRLSATFVEPSEAASYLSAWALFELTLVISGAKDSGWHWTCVVAGTMALVETASTTGYLTVAVMWMVISLSIVRTVVARGLLNVRALLAVSIMGMGAGLALFAMPSAQILVSGVLLGKSSSASGVHRMATIGRSVEVFRDTLSLGAGLGSNRAMSLFFYVLSNVGLPGTILLSWLLWQLWKQYSQWKGRSSYRTVRQFINATGVAFLANFLAMVFSGAEVTAPRLWVLWGMLLVGLRTAYLAGR